MKVTLNDCLACSGCVTSAETILLEQQSCEQVLGHLKLDLNAVVFTISRQTVAALSALFGTSMWSMLHAVAAELKSLGAAAVYDIQTARDLSLLHAAKEFVQR